MLVVRLELWRANRVFHVTLGVVRLALADDGVKPSCLQFVRRWWGRAKRSDSGRSCVRAWAKDSHGVSSSAHQG